MLKKIGKTKAKREDEERFASLTGKYRFLERGEDMKPYIAREMAVIRRLVPTGGQLHFKVEYTGSLSKDDFRVICTHGIKCTGCTVSLPYVNVFTDFM